MALVAISALPASTTIITTDVLPFVRGGTTDKITAGNLRTQIFAFAATDPLNCGILTAVGNSTITGTLTGVTSITASGSVTVTGELVSSDRLRLGGNLVSVAASGTIYRHATSGLTYWPIVGATSDSTWLNGAGSTVFSNPTGTTNLALVGALAMGGALSGVTTLAMAGALSGVTTITMSSTLTLTTAASQIVPGATSLSLRNNANNADNILVTDAGVVTIRAGLTVTAGGLTVSAGTSAVQALTATTASLSSTLTFTTAASQIIPGATSIAFRNNANNANNLLIADSGLQTWRGNVQMANATAIWLGVGVGSGIFSSTGTNQLIAENRITGFTNGWTGAAADKATAYDASTITLPQLAARVRALQEALTAASSGHGLIGA